jgi:hypothetical protein
MDGGLGGSYNPAVQFWDALIMSPLRWPRYIEYERKRTRRLARPCATAINRRDGAVARRTSPRIIVDRENNKMEAEL